MERIVSAYMQNYTKENGAKWLTFDMCHSHTESFLFSEGWETAEYP